MEPKDGEDTKAQEGSGAVDGQPAPDGQELDEAALGKVVGGTSSFGAFGSGRTGISFGDGGGSGKGDILSGAIRSDVFSGGGGGAG